MGRFTQPRRGVIASNRDAVEAHWNPVVSAVAGFAIGALVAVPAAPFQVQPETARLGMQVMLVGLVMAALATALTILRNRMLRRR